MSNDYQRAFQVRRGQRYVRVPVGLLAGLLATAQDHVVQAAECELGTLTCSAVRDVAFAAMEVNG